MLATARLIELSEYKPLRIPREQLNETVAEDLWRHYPNQVNVEFPSPQTDWQWQLTTQGWVGFIPLTPELGLALRAKVDIHNLFRMLEYAYKLDILLPKETVFSCDSLEEFYERLALVLARRILDRSRKGFYRSYVQEDEGLAYLAGRLDENQLMKSAWNLLFQCSYQNHTVDLEENQILMWTLSNVARSGMCSERVLPTVRRAYRTLQPLVSLEPYGPMDCTKRLYNRLNEDYRPMHGLCRFFLENTGPRHNAGNRVMIPFLVDTERLFELFVAEWLKLHLPPGIDVGAQEKVIISRRGNLYFKIDLVLYDSSSASAFYVLDTKYKISETPATDDIAQVIAYAQAKGCSEAALVYPAALAAPLDEWVGDVHVRSLTFALDEDVDSAGGIFLKELLRDLSAASQ